MGLICVGPGRVSANKKEINRITKHCNVEEEKIYKDSKNNEPTTNDSQNH